MDVARQNSPPPPGPEVEIKRLRAGEELTCWILSPQVWGFWVHWCGNHSEPCHTDRSKCPGHRRGMPLRWKGYFYVYDVENRELKFLEVTPVACASLQSQLPDAKNARGTCVRIRRMNGDRARLKVALIHAEANGEKLPKDRDPYPVLAKLWGLGQKNSKQQGTDEPGFSGSDR